MAEVILSVIYAFIFAGIIARTNIINGNPRNLTLRGRRFLFIASFVIGIVMAQPILHFFVNCDTSVCTTTWK